MLWFTPVGHFEEAAQHTQNHGQSAHKAKRLANYRPSRHVQGMAAISVYVDEAGDPGAKDGLRFLGDRHEWFTFGALVVRTSMQEDLVGWVKELREEARARQAGALHYAQITRGRRTGVCERLAQKPCRAFVFASHKSNLRSYFNPRLNKPIDPERVYNWCFRLLLERVTAWVEQRQLSEIGKLEPLRLVLAQRGHGYNHFNSYIDRLRWQRENGQLFLKGPGLAPVHLDRTEWVVEQAALNPGLQLSDVIASAFYQGANEASPSYDIGPAVALKRIVANVNLWPLAHQGGIPEAARPLFEAYDYIF